MIDRFVMRYHFGMIKFYGKLCKLGVIDKHTLMRLHEKHLHKSLITSIRVLERLGYPDLVVEIKE